MMDAEEMNIRKVKKYLGENYFRLNWLTKEKTKSANKKRDALLKYLSNGALLGFSGCKIYTGKLSPGCLACEEACWSCAFINRLCSARCFFCPRDVINGVDNPPEESGFTIGSPDDYAGYLKKFKFRGVSFSGGEPFLVFDKLLSYVAGIKTSLGDKIYVWVYSNGTLATNNKLMLLKKAGLDEIRFNICAVNYNLQAVELAARIIDTVTVEIPAIPEDTEIVKRCLQKMLRLGVKHLNLHQLSANSFNFKMFAKRSYTFLHNPALYIYESEISALMIIKYALENKIDLPINYCSGIFKEGFQPRGDRRWKAPLIKNAFEELTQQFMIRRLSIRDTRRKIEALVDTFLKNNCTPTTWSLNDSSTEIFIHGSLLTYINFDKYNLVVSYFEPSLESSIMREDVAVSIRHHSLDEKFIKRSLVFEREIKSAEVAECFRKSFVIGEGDHTSLLDFLPFERLSVNSSEIY